MIDGEGSPKANPGPVVEWNIFPLWRTAFFPAVGSESAGIWAVDILPTLKTDHGVDDLGSFEDSNGLVAFGTTSNREKSIFTGDSDVETDCTSCQRR